MTKMVEKSNRLFRALVVTLLLVAVTTLIFSIRAAAGTGTTGTEYKSKGTVTDESSINIDSTDIYTLDNAIAANNRTVENYASTAGDIYNNLSAIDSAIAKAKTEIAQNLEDMNIYVSRNDAGAINSHAGTTDWVGTTMAAKSAAVANYTLEELIGQMKISVTGSGSEMTAKINAGDFKNKSATSSITSGSQSVNLSGMTEINLDKNQQVVLPSGYYGNGMTINNVISGETLNWNPEGKDTKVIDRPYTSGVISTENAYKKGYDTGYKAGCADGAATAVANRPNVNITYRVRHTHGSYCYEEAIPEHSEWKGNRPQGDGHSVVKKWESTTRCSVCKQSWTDSSGNGWPGHDGTDGRFYNHLVNGRCPQAKVCCGKPEGEYTTTNAISIGSGDTLVAAEVRY